MSTTAIIPAPTAPPAQFWRPLRRALVVTYHQEAPEALPVATILAPACVRVLLPPDGAAEGTPVKFTYRHLSFSAVVPAAALIIDDSNFIGNVTVLDWKNAHAAMLQKRREDAARQAAIRRAEKQLREVKSVLDSVIYEVEAHEREVRQVVRDLVSTVELNERRRLAVERKEAQQQREVAHCLERLIAKVIRLDDPRYDGIDAPAYAKKQLEALDAYLVALGGAQGLVNGWSIRVDVRRTGGTAGETGALSWLSLSPSLTPRVAPRRF